MDELRIIGWTNFDCEYPAKKLTAEELQVVLKLIKDEIIEKKYIFSGEEHQYGLTGVPVFSDGTCFRASMRCWALIMASLYNGQDGQQLSYMDFYMSLGEESIMPEFVEIDVEPAILEEEADGCMIPQDRQMIEQSLSLGMPLMTTDKVLSNIYKKIQEEE